jgi:putative ABC transport system permease protein
MLLPFRVALRNVIRSRQRSILFTLLIVGGLLSILVFISFSERVFWGVRESVINSQTGHIQIVKQGFWEKRFSEPRRYLLDGVEALRSDVKGTFKSAKLVSPRLEFSGLIGYGESTTVFTGLGVEPDADTLLSSFDRIIAGKALTRDDGAQITIGSKLAATLNVQVGDVVLLMTTTIDGVLNAVDVGVKGIFESDSDDYNGRALKIPLNIAQSTLQTDKVSRMVVLLRDTEDTQAARDLLDNAFAKNWPGLDIRDWQTLNPGYDKVVSLYLRIFVFLGATIVVMLTIAIASMTAMNVIERTREIALMKAMGTSTRLVKSVFFIENTLIVTFGFVLSVILFEIVFYAINNFFGGISMPPPPGSSNATLFLLKLPYHALPEIMISMALVVLLATIFTISNVSRIEASEALRHG